MFCYNTFPGCTLSRSAFVFCTCSAAQYPTAQTCHSLTNPVTPRQVQARQSICFIGAMFYDLSSMRKPAHRGGPLKPSVLVTSLSFSGPYLRGSNQGAPA